ncbi:MAG: Outer membrane protein assembly factor BamB [Phycisphaerae bacterium]|nr:Outer membrane protein assembly factor BamB [Phycisphaerae bacterium]
MTSHRNFLLAAATLALVATLTESLPAGPPTGTDDWPMWGGSPDRNMVSAQKGLPLEWDVKTGRNIKWASPLGSQAYGNPTVAGGRVYVGTNNIGEFRPSIKGDKGILLCFDEATGKLLWQATHDKLPTGRVNDWPEQGVCSTPAVDGDRVYYVSNRCELVCADANGFLDGVNNGPFKEEKYHDRQDADFIWVLDMMEELAVFPHNMAASSPLVVGDMVYVVTGNGVDEGHINIPSPRAPSFIAVNKMTGKVVWENGDPADKILHGQWSSPSYMEVRGRGLILFPGGDGWLRALDARTGELVWKFDMNPKDSVWKLGGRGTRNNIIATPCVHDGKVYLAVGQDPEHGEGVGHLYCIDATKEGDITETGRVWHFGDKDFGRTLSTVAVVDGLCYASELAGFLHCLDAATGKPLWEYDCKSAIWGSPMVADGRIYIGTEYGDVIVLQQGRQLKELAINVMGSSVYNTPVAANGTLYVANRRKLFAIRQGAAMVVAADAPTTQEDGAP